MRNITVLVSGSGTNLQNIINATKNGKLDDATVKLVIADRPCFALERAKVQNIPSILLKRGKQLSGDLQNHIPEDTDLIVLAGFLSILSEAFCKQWEGKIINIHPSLLPKFGGKGMWGMHVHEAVIESGDLQSGATVHRVTGGIDQGEIILQDFCDVAGNDNAETLAAKVHAIEFEILPRAIAKVLQHSRPFFTTDLSDAHSDLQIAQPIGLQHFGKRSYFSGEIVTIKAKENNPLVRSTLGENGKGKVLVVDGDGSDQCAMIGDNIAKLAVDNAWEGVVLNAYIRDSVAIADLPIGVMALGTIPIKSGKLEVGEKQVPLDFAKVKFVPGEYIYADEDGIVLSKKRL